MGSFRPACCFLDRGRTIFGDNFVRKIWKNLTRPEHYGYAGGLALAVLLLGLAGTAVIYRVSAKLITQEARLRFDNGAREVGQRIATRIRLYSDVLVTMQAFFSAGGDDVSRSEFRDFVQGLDLPRRYPGFQTLNYAPYICRESVAHFVALQRRDPMLRQAGIDFSIRPVGSRPAYYVLTYLEPLEANLSSVGLDLGQEPRRLAALERSRDMGLPVSSGRLIFPEGSRPVGIALRLPVYRKGMPHDTVATRRLAYLGSVGAGIRVKDLMAGLLGDEVLNAIHFRIDDTGTADAPAIPPSPSTLLFDSVGGLAFSPGLPHTPPAALTASVSPVGVIANRDQWLTQTLDQPFGGRRWRITLTADPVTLIGTNRYLPQLAALMGTVVSILLGGLAWALSTSRVRAVALAQQITQTLRTSELARAEAQRIAHLGDWRVSADRTTVHLSNEMARLIGWPSEGTALDMLVAAIEPADRARLIAHAKRTLRTGVPFQLECRYRSRRGRRGWLHLIGQASGQGDARILRGTALEITQRKSAACAQQLEHTVMLRLAAALPESNVFELLVDIVVEGMEWEAGAFWPTEAGRQLAPHRTHRVRVPELEPWLRSRPERTLADGDSVEPCWSTGKQTVTRLAHGAWLATVGITTVFAFPVHAGLLKLGTIEFYARERRQREPHGLAMARSIALQLNHFLLRRQAEDNLRFIANHDALTGLPNRLMFRDRLDAALARARREQTALYVLFVDLDQFKDVNDSLGHNAGDTLLRAVADRLLLHLGNAGVVARLGGDEFVVLVEEQRGRPVDIAHTVQAIQSALAGRFAVGERQLPVTASIGISAFPDDGDDAQTLLKHADIAMYGAKGQGKNTYQVYARQMSTSLQRRIDMESHLRQAVEHGELVLYYQPRICLHSNRCTGVEALVRWQHPILGFVQPMDFIPLAEETGAIVAIGTWVLREACRQNAAWLASGLAPIRVAVNLSARQFADKNLHQDIVTALADARLPGELLELELTESMVMRHAEEAAAWLSSLKRTGVRLAIDDFGTGYSSLAYLNRFPIDIVKIDRSFIRNVPESRSDAQIASAIIALGHSLGLEVVAEGAENQAHVDFLRREGCDEIQGYFYSQPLPASEMTALLARWRSSGPVEAPGPQSARVRGRTRLSLVKGV